MKKAKFITLTTDNDNEPLIVNTRHIDFIYPNKEGAKVFMIGRGKSHFTVIENLQQIENLLQSSRVTAPSNRATKN